MTRVAGGAALDRTQSLMYSWRGQRLTGFAGDTVASALMAADVLAIDTGLRSGRPRGTLSADWEDPGGFVVIEGSGSRTAALAATTPLRAGMVLRPLEGRARLDVADDRRFLVRTRFVDVVVVGAGAQGAQAAGAAGAHGEEVLLLDASVTPTRVPDGVPVLWNTRALHHEPGADSSFVVAVQSQGDSEVLWRLHAGRVHLATGSRDRLPVFPGNDLPGILFVSAARRLLESQAVVPGRNLVVSAGPGAHDLAQRLLAAGCRVLLVDPRSEGEADLCAWAPNPTEADARGRRGVADRPAELSVVGGQVVEARGRAAVTSVVVESAGIGRDVACDGLIVSTGRDERGDLQAAFEPGLRALPESIPALSLCEHGVDECTCFVDANCDVRVADLRAAVQRGIRHAEHVKRATRAGTGIDQGRLGAVPSAQALATLTGQAPGAVGTSGARSPISPVSLGAFAGARSARTATPVREGPLAELYSAAGFLRRIERRRLVHVAPEDAAGVQPAPLPTTFVAELSDHDVVTVSGSPSAAAAAVAALGGAGVPTERVNQPGVDRTVDERLWCTPAGRPGLLGHLVPVRAGSSVVVGSALGDGDCRTWLAAQAPLRSLEHLVLTELQDGLVPVIVRSRALEDLGILAGVTATAQHGSGLRPLRPAAVWNSAADPEGAVRLLLHRPDVVPLVERLLEAGAALVGRDAIMRDRAERAVLSARDVPAGVRAVDLPQRVMGLVGAPGDGSAVAPGALVAQTDPCTGAPGRVVGQVTSAAAAPSGWSAIATVDRGADSPGTGLCLVHAGQVLPATTRNVTWRSHVIR